MDEKKQSEVLAFFWFMISVLAFISLSSYSPNDIPFEVSVPNQPVRNVAGVAGAYTAWALFLFFGKVAYLLIPLCLFWAFAKWAGKKGQKVWLKLFATAAFLASACALFSLIARHSETSRFTAGGIIGFFTGEFLAGVFGKAGLFVALSLFILSIILATELLVLQMTVGLFRKIRKWIKPLFEARKKRQPKVAPAFGVPEFKPRPAVEVKPEIRVHIPAASATKASADLRPAEKPKFIVPAEVPAGSYILPSLDLLDTPKAFDKGKLQEDLKGSTKVLEDTLRDFNIEAKVVSVEQGPTITRYELQPAAGVKVQRITSLENDIALAMRATSVRIVAPIPGKALVGIEVPSAANSTVFLREVLSTPEFQNETSKVTVALGKDIGGAPMICNLSDMPHILIAGATNTGKSVCMNSIIASMLFKATPDELKFLMIDPKMVELHFYNDLPHLLTPVITDKAKAPGVLAWLIAEMERRYKVLNKTGARNIGVFNQKVENKEITPQSLKINEDNEDEAVIVKKMPYIVLIIDELADLMLASAQEVENSITRLAQLARAVGVHMVLATQRPSIDVITGLIKANIPARIAFQVVSQVDSRVVLDQKGAEKLLGRGDMLFQDPRKTKLIRAQGALVQDKEIERLTNFIKTQRKASYEDLLQAGAKRTGSFADFKRDEVYDEAKRLVLETGQASVSMVQRRLGLGYTRAARLIDMMEEDGVVGPYRGAKPREILVERPNRPVQEEAKHGDRNDA